MMRCRIKVAFYIFVSISVATCQELKVSDERTTSQQLRRKQEQIVVSASVERTDNIFIQPERSSSASVSRQSSSASTTTRVFVRCKDRTECKKLLLESSGMVGEESDFEDGLVIMDADETQLAQLESNDNINVEKDNMVIGFSQLKPEFLDGIGTPLMMSGDITTNRRELEEVEPYGIRMVQANRLRAGDSEVKVCIVDSGIAIGHPDLDASMISGTNNRRLNGDVLEWDKDRDGHGTHVAGTMAAAIGNGEGVRGVAHINLHITRGLDDYGVGFESDVQRALSACLRSGAKVISLSLGSRTISSTLRRTYRNIVMNRGVLVVAASGNDGFETYQFPASHPNVISVGAVTPGRERASFSTYSDQVELMGPGMDIVSTSISNYAVITEDFSYPAYHLGTRPLQVEGELVNCNTGSERCIGARRKICLIFRSNTDVATMITNCVRAGGIGAIIYGSENQRWFQTASTIPVLLVAPTTGQILLRSFIRLESSAPMVTLGFATRSEPEYTYATASGTSMAAPHVAAVAALVWSHYPECTNHQIRYALAATARDIGDPGCDSESGYGIVRARKAFNYLRQNSCTSEDYPDVSPSSGGCSTLG